MRLTLVVFLSLAACAKNESRVATTCKRDVSAHMIEYPDHQFRKSDVSTCSDGCSYVQAVSEAKENFSVCSQALVER